MQSEVKEEAKVNKGIYRRFLKRPMDFILSLMAIIVLSPVLIIVGVLVRVKLGSPVLFKQKIKEFGMKNMLNINKVDNFLHINKEVKFLNTKLEHLFIEEIFGKGFEILNQKHNLF